ncbi:MAG: excinuclease ABC subunit C [Gemmatimonas sp.]|nr:excinuclease ABC subunit C [Gemmatimonas sp.]
MSQDVAFVGKLKHLPSGPGVYLMKAPDGEVLYVGKAKSLRSRVRSYFGAGVTESVKTQELVRRIADVDTIVVGSEAEALILENNLIKEYRPRFNINLRDDKTYPYVKVTVREPFPRVFVTRRLIRDGSRYFGPYTNVGRMRHLLEVVKRLYTVRSCHYRLPTEAPPRPCLDYHIGRCKAPCVGLQSEEDYRAMIDEVVDILGGHTKRAARRIRQEMEEAAREMRFERAAELRDALAHLERLEAQQKIVDISGSDRDVIGLARDGNEACGVVLRIREGKLLAREAVNLVNLDGEADDAVMGTFATRFYTSRSQDETIDVPPEVLFPIDFEDRPVLEAWLRDKVGRSVRTHVPRRGEKVRLVELAAQNSRHVLEERKLLGDGSSARAPDALYELQELLELPNVPRTIACFDVSHTQGSETVASAVFVTNGAPDRAEYRRFRIRGEWGNDDYRSLEEALLRYLRRRLEEDRGLPDLLVIDGGKGQLGAARAALEALDLSQQPVISLAKREEEVFVPGRPDPIRLPRRSAALRLLQRARNEAHRFAITYNRKLRTRRTVTSGLAEIAGVGPARQRALLARFGSVRAIGKASAEEISGVPGIGPALAQTILEHVNQNQG